MQQQPFQTGHNQSPHPQSTQHLYSWQTLVGLSILYLISCLLFGITQIKTGTTDPDNVPILFQIFTAIGAICLLLLHGILIIVDAHNFFTLNGKIHWRLVKGWTRIGLIFVFSVFWIVPFLYLFFAIQYFWEVRSQQNKATNGSASIDMDQRGPIHSQAHQTTQHNNMLAGSVVSNGAREVSMPQHTPQRTKVFISYSHKDVSYLQRLQIHFAHYERRGMVDVWDDTKIAPGASSHEEMQNALAQTKVALLLVSADYLASQSITENELPPLLSAAQTEGATILPIIVSACAFEDSDLAQFQPVNSLTQPLSGMDEDDREKIWATVAKMVNTIIHSYSAPPNKKKRFF